jgi:hypothetical protein
LLMKMKLPRKSIGFAALLVAVTMPFQIVLPAGAKYWGAVDIPGWSGADGYARQSWGFGAKPQWHKVDLDQDGDKDAYMTDEPGYGPDVQAGNGQGEAFFIRSDFGDVFAWDWLDQGPMMLNWDGLQGMIGGMGTGSFDFMVPGGPEPVRPMQFWIQAVVYLSNGQDGSATKTVLAADSDFARAQGSLVDKQWRRIGQLDDRGAGGQWWRVTERWQIDRPGRMQFIRIRSTRGSVTLIDSVDIVARTLDVDQGEKKGKEGQ